MKAKSNNKLLYILFMFYIISIVSIYSFSKYIDSSSTLIIKQTIFYITGFILIFIIKKMNINTILKYSNHIYIINILLLFFTLIFGKEINGSKAWFSIPIIGNFQPSEFMKIGIILMLAKILKENDSDIIKILKTIIIVIIPSILTFLEPDTGSILIYIIIAIFMLYMSGIKKIWFILGFSIIFILVAVIFILYYKNPTTFINIFSNNLYYRLERLISWKASSGYQLENSLITIGASKLFGNGTNNILLYFPEGHTDFIFTSYSTNFGIFGILILFISIIYFDLHIINLSVKTKNLRYKYILSGIISCIMYQQIQNIAMTIGLLPITGITLPFISYGGSSLISFCILLGIVINIENLKER